MAFSPIRNASLITKVLILSMAIGTSLWGLFDYFQGKELRIDFQRQLEEQLESEASVDRELFDLHVRGLHYAARLIVSQKNMFDYLMGDEWREATGTTTIRHIYRPPAWLPPNSILRTFFHAHAAMLLGPDGDVKQVYHSAYNEDGDETLTSELYQPGHLLRKLSHSQAYLTMMDGEPYVITTQDIVGETGELLATLLLSTQINSDFLYTAKQSSGTDSVLAILDVEGESVVASSDPVALPPGSLTETLKQDYLMIGKSFFDYGASDLELQFASFIATSRSERIVEQLLERESHRRAILALTLILLFTLLTIYVALRIKRLNLIVHDLSNDFLGITTLRGRGDEIGQLEDQFKQLTSKLEHTYSENMSLHGKVIDTEKESRSLRLVTELLSVGVVIDGINGLEPFNDLMKNLVLDFGGAESFLLEGKQHAEVHLVDRHNISRSFTIDHHKALGPRGVLVSETTDKMRLEEERDLFANFPTYDPNPVVRIDREGNVIYTNLAMRELLAQIDPGQTQRIPREWLRQYDQHVAMGMTSELEFTVGSCVYTFVVALLGAEDGVYLFGQDVTEKREAEREVKLAATVIRNVLDGVVITDTQGIIQQLNPGFSEIFGYTDSDLIGKPSELIHASSAEDAVQKHVWRGLEDYGYWQGEIWKKHKDDSTIFCLVRVNAIHDDSGQITNYVVMYSDITERKQHEEWLAHIAFHDPLTRLPNRRLLEDRLEQNIAQAQRNNTSLAVLYLDLDGFKPVNDRLGHDVGDQLLCEVAVRLHNCVRSSDTVSRVGGDEFVIVLPEFATEADVQGVAQKAIQELQRRFVLAEQSVQISTSIGIAIYPHDGDSAVALIKAADQAMYEVKHHGKNAYKMGSSRT